MAMENGPFIGDSPMKRDFPANHVCLPEGNCDSGDLKNMIVFNQAQFLATAWEIKGMRASFSSHASQIKFGLVFVC